MFIFNPLKYTYIRSRVNIDTFVKTEKGQVPDDNHGRDRVIYFKHTGKITANYF